MRWRLVTLATVAIIVGACTSGTESSTGTTEASTATTGGPITTSPSAVAEASSTTEPADTTETTSDRPLAPDFTLELGDGGSFTLSEGARPVYLVFWAEW